MNLANRRAGAWCMVLTAAFLAAGCGGGGNEAKRTAEPKDNETTSTRTDDAPESDAPEPPTTPGEEAPTAEDTKVFRVRIEGGQPVGGPTAWRVQQGDQVRISVRSDTSDELHLHGYDVSKDVEAGSRADLVLTATEPGSFELELEHTAVLVGNLEVR